MKTITISCGRNVVINGRCYLAQQELFAPGEKPAHASGWGTTAQEALSELRRIKQEYPHNASRPITLYHYEQVTT